MYKQTYWKDHVTQYPNRRTVTENPDGTVDVEKAQGTVIQQGTPQSGTNFNNQEDGIQAAHITEQIRMQYQMQKEREVDSRLNAFDAEFTNEVGTIDLTNSMKFPFNNSQKTVSLKQARKTLNYDVNIEVTASAGNIGDIHISEKQLNGFKIAFDGSASAVTIKYRIQGGMLV